MFNRNNCYKKLVFSLLFSSPGKKNNLPIFFVIKTIYNDHVFFFFLDTEKVKKKSVIFIDRIYFSEKLTFVQEYM